MQINLNNFGFLPGKPWQNQQILKSYLGGATLFQHIFDFSFIVRISMLINKLLV